MAGTNLLKIASWNCNGLKRKKEFIAELCNDLDIVALQETLLMSHDLNETENIHRDFKCFSKSSVDSNIEILTGRPYGGLSFMWHNSLDRFINIINYASDRLLGLCLKLDNCKILFLNVYLPYQDTNLCNFDHYVQSDAKVVPKALVTIFWAPDGSIFERRKLHLQFTFFNS